MTSAFEPPSGAVDLGAQAREYVADIEAAAVFGSKLSDTVGEHVAAHADLGPDGARFPHLIEVNGVTLGVRKPRPEALHAFSMAVSKHSKADIQNDMVTLFVRSHIAPSSYETLLEQMMDPDGTFGVDDLGEVMRRIATLGTARPTAPSQP